MYFSSIDSDNIDSLQLNYHTINETHVHYILSKDIALCYASRSIYFRIATTQLTKC